MSFRSHLAAAIALALASGAAFAAEAPVLRVAGEPALAAKSEAIVAWRQPSATAVSRLGFPELDVQRIAELERHNERSGKATQIGIERRIGEAAGALPALRWMAVAGGHVARFEISSTDAMGLRVGLRLSGVQDGLEMRFAGSLAPDRLLFADAESIRYQNANGTLLYWTPVTDGDTQTVEIFVPAGVEVGRLRIAVESISHLLTNSIEGFSLAKAIGDSGACNVDTVCRVGTLGQHFVNAKNAVARMVFTDGGTYTCTGTLLNDTDGSTQIPYFYTADHCIDRQSVALTLNTYWGFEATTCGGSTPAANTQLTGGSDWLFSQSGSTSTDGALLRLRQAPPAGSFFSGWNATTVANNADVLAIHHPSGDLKKSSTGKKRTQDANLIEVGWLSGTTEGGSSGSGLFTLSASGYELRGGLFRGGASCANTGNMNNAGNWDEYSRLDVMYPHIQQWLAPTPSGDPGPTRDHTGAWWVPSESGWGLTAFQYDNENQTLFVMFFIYDSTGKATWYELGGGWTADDVRSGDVFESSAAPWSTTYNPASRSFTPAGNATLTFTSATTATLNFTIDGVTRNVTLSKL